jgi:predicted NUDIX family phosphoesterase
MNEEVMVVEAADLQPFLAGRPTAIIREGSDGILRLIGSEHFFVDRATAEVSPRWRQIIPYVVVRHEDSCFLLRRTRKQNEARLHDKLSLGIGGHINPGHDLLSGLRKELEEEVRIDDAYELAFAGILNDEATEVGRVHLGVVYVLRASSARVRVLETEKMKGEWVPLAGLGAQRAAMESWSQIVYDQLLSYGEGP